ncbi:MAG: hypothetical protein K2L10_06955 [Ruminococcus sp.]|nr:hypothetical protein [Ruminococcus sp.]
MKKTVNRKVFFLIITAIAISGFIIICTLAQSVRNTKIQTKFASNVPEVVQPECIVREYNGKIGVFRGTGDKPYKVIDYDVGLLSEYDREQLSGGMIMESDDELRKFIEDMFG